MKAPSQEFIPIYVDDFRADTYFMSLEELGAYTLLLIQAHHEGGSLPNDDVYLRRILKLSNRRWQKLRPAVMRLFPVSGARAVSKHLMAFYARRGRPSLPAWLRMFILERDGYVCAYCSTDKGPFDIDHIMPVCKGGTDDPENLTCACASCNRSKGGRTLEEWRAR